MSALESLARKIPDKLKPPLRMFFLLYREVMTVMLRFYGKRIKARKFRKYDPLKLNIGCGKAKFPGWVNIDISPSADLTMDLRGGLPFEDNSVSLVYSEHFLEHLTLEEGEKVLKESNRCLKKEGVLRIAMPDLDYIIQKYNSPDWTSQDWLSRPAYKFIKTKGRMINTSFRSWGHKYLYNEEDLRDLLVKAGFHKDKIIRCDWNESNCVTLCGLETRKDSKLIIEAEKK